MRHKKSIVFAGGGSGGHVAPIRAVIPGIKDSDHFSALYWIGTERFEQKAASELGVTFIKISTGKLRRYFDLKNFSDVFLTVLAVLRCVAILLRIKPEVVFASGGFVSVPVVLAAKLLRVKIVIHEQTMALGMANRISSVCANRILLGFASSTLHLPFGGAAKATVVGNPVNKSLLVKGDVRRHFPISSKAKKIVYVTGGSQGATIINKNIWKILPKLVAKDWCVIHQCGKYDIAAARQLESRYRGYYFAAEYLEGELASIYQSADIVISRSGAGTVNELAYFGIPAVLVPLEPNDNGEQKMNARDFIQRCPGAIVKQPELTPEALWRAIASLESSQRLRNWEAKTDESARLITDVLIGA